MVNRVINGLNNRLFEVFQRFQIERRGYKTNVDELKVIEINDFSSYQKYQRKTSGLTQRRLEFEKGLSKNKKPFYFDGFCYICNSEVKFKVGYEHAIKVDGQIIPNYREHLSCNSCGFNNRMRAAIHLLETEVGFNGSIYMTEQITPLFKLINKRFSNVIGSEYLGTKISFGTCNEEGIRNESITNLTFDDFSFDSILSFDVLEHVPIYIDGFKECLRTLKPGGKLLFSVPFTRLENTYTRAIVEHDGSIKHIHPPEYHGDPLTQEGCLCFHHFGWDLLDQLRAIGFSSAVAMLYWSKEWGYLGNGEQIVFVAAKPF